MLNIIYQFLCLRFLLMSYCIAAQTKGIDWLRKKLLALWDNVDLKNVGKFRVFDGKVNYTGFFIFFLQLLQKFPNLFFVIRGQLTIKLLQNYYF